MNTLRKIPRALVLYPFLSLALILAAFAPAIRPHHATAGSSEQAHQSDWSRALPNWWSTAAPSPAAREYLLADAITRVQIESPIGTEIVAQTLDADAKLTFYAVGYSDGAGSTQVVTWTLSADVGSLSPIRGVTTTLDAGSVGSALLTATLVTTPSISATARITVTPGAAAWLSLSPASETITAGESVMYTAVAYDQDDNQVGDVTASTTFTTDAAAGGTWADEEYTSEKSGEWTVVGSHINAADSEVTGAATLTVSPGELDHIRINSAANDGAEVVSHTLDIYEQFTVWAGCYDQFDNYCGDVEADWEATGVLAQGGLAPNPATSTTFTPAPILSGTGSISATYVHGDQTDSTGLITVTAPWLVISKTDLNDPVAPGGILRYTLHYTNTGNAPVPSVVVTETYDQRVTYAYANPAPVNAGKNVWVLDGIDPGESNDFLFLVEVEVADTLEPGAVLTNVVTVGGPRLGAYSFTETTTVTSTTALNPSLWLWVNNGRSSVRAGERITYALSYINAGNKDAQDTTIVATPPPAQYISDIECRPSSICDASGTPVVYDLGTVHSGESDTVELIVTVEDPLPAGARDLVVAASIHTDTPGDPTQGNNALDRDDIATAPDLIVTADYEWYAPWPGKTVAHRIQYTNAGHIATTGVNIIATLSPYTTFQDEASDPGWIALGGGRYRYAAGELDYLDSGNLSFVVKLTDTRFTPSMINFDTTFTIYDDGQSGEDANPDDNIFEARLGVPNLVIENVILQDSIWDGQPGLLTATVRNIGTGVACGIWPQYPCAIFFLDLFPNAGKPPSSYPFEEDAQCDVQIDSIPPGGAFTAHVVFTDTERASWPADKSGLCEATTLERIWLKVDNWPTYAYGLVPENNEFDNVWPPPILYLPMVSKSNAGRQFIQR
jgi:uncharacterized repeat protein (TIGR01451 family)